MITIGFCILDSSIIIVMMIAKMWHLTRVEKRIFIPLLYLAVLTRAN